MLFKLNSRLAVAGMSLLEVTIATGLLGGTMLGVSTFMQSYGKIATQTKGQANQANIRGYLSQIASSAPFCSNALVGKSQGPVLELTTANEINIYDTTGTVVFLHKDSTYNNLKINSVTLKLDSTASIINSPHSYYGATLQVSVSQPTTAAVSDIPIRLSVKLDPLNKLVSCNSFNNAKDLNSVIPACGPGQSLTGDGLSFMCRTTSCNKGEYQDLPSDSTTGEIHCTTLPSCATGNVLNYQPNPQVSGAFQYKCKQVVCTPPLAVVGLTDDGFLACGVVPVECSDSGGEICDNSNNQYNAYIARTCIAPKIENRCAVKSGTDFPNCSKDSTGSWYESCPSIDCTAAANRKTVSGGCKLFNGNHRTGDCTGSSGTVVTNNTRDYLGGALFCRFNGDSCGSGFSRKYLELVYDNFPGTDFEIYGYACNGDPCGGYIHCNCVASISGCYNNPHCNNKTVTDQYYTAAFYGWDKYIWTESTSAKSTDSAYNSTLYSKLRVVPVPNWCQDPAAKKDDNNSTTTNYGPSTVYSYCY